MSKSTSHFSTDTIYATVTLLFSQVNVYEGFSISDLGYKIYPEYDIYHSRITPSEENNYMWRIVRAGTSKYNGNLVNENDYFDLSREDNRQSNICQEWEREKKAEKSWDHR